MDFVGKAHTHSDATLIIALMLRPFCGEDVSVSTSDVDMHNPQARKQSGHEICWLNRNITSIIWWKTSGNAESSVPT